MNKRIFTLVLLICVCLNYSRSDDAVSHKKIYHSSHSSNANDITFFDENGNILFKKEIFRCYGFNEGYAVVQLKNFDSAILDENGNISEARFEQLGQKFSEGKNFAWFLDGTTGVVDTKGNVLYKIDIADFDGALAATPFFNGRALIKKAENVWFMIDENGSKLKEFTIFYAREFHCGLSAIQFRSNNIRKYNYVDTDGNLISAVNFDEAEDFADNKARVRIGSDEFYIDTEGNRL